MEINGHKILLKVVVGSHAYGTNVEGSDIDIKGIFIQDPESILEDGYLPQIEVNKDEVYYELGRFVELVTGGNPTMLEILFAPADTVIKIDSLLIPLLQERDKLLTKQLRWSFGGYAIDQIKKARGLDKKMNWEEDRKVRKDVLDFCYFTSTDAVPYDHKSVPIKDWMFEYQIGLAGETLGLAALPNFRYCYNVFIDFDNEFNYKGIVQDLKKSNDVSLSDIPKGQKRVGILYFNKDGYSQHCKEYNSYLTWLKERNEQRYVDIESHGQKIDGKNMLHCTRLLEVASEIAKGEGLNVRRPNSDYLISIRKGEVPLEDILIAAEGKISEFDELFEKSNLPEKADTEYFKEIVKKIRKTNYREIEDKKIEQILLDYNKELLRKINEKIEY